MVNSTHNIICTDAQNYMTHIGRHTHNVAISIKDLLHNLVRYKERDQFNEISLSQGISERNTPLSVFQSIESETSYKVPTITKL